MSAHTQGRGGQAGHAQGLSQNQKSVALAVFVIVALLATVVYFVKRGERRAGAHPEPKDRTAQLTPEQRPQLLIDRKALPAGPEGRRIRYAAGLERRFQRRGRNLSIRAVGSAATNFEISYPATAPDQKHIDELRVAEALHRELQGRGFAKFSIRIGERQVFSKDL